MIRLGTRGSALALAQANWVAERLEGEVEIVPIRTSSDERERMLVTDESGPKKKRRRRRSGKKKAGADDAPPIQNDMGPET